MSRTVNILAFGIAREIVGSHRLTINIEDGTKVGGLLSLLKERYAPLRELASLLVAQDADIASEEDLIHEGSELALIPPVSGG